MKKLATQQPLVLAIDTSCDDTAAAVVCGRQVWSNVVASQAELHRQYGGVFPTLAKQAHREQIEPCIKLALRRAGIDWSHLTAIAVTVGPGLAPALEVGIAAAIAAGQEHHLPVLSVNHLEGHVLSVLAQPGSKYHSSSRQVSLPTQQKPVLALIVSGGHTQMLTVRPAGQKTASHHNLDRQPNASLIDRENQTALTSGQFAYELLGETQDDAAGECLDKIGRLLNLGYPAGPVMEVLARSGNPQRYPFPLPMTVRHDYHLSFSGLKTHARNLITKLWPDMINLPPTQQEVADFCACAQQAVFRHITYKLDHLLQLHQFEQIWLGGGVAANRELRKHLRQVIRKHQKHLTNQHLAVPYNLRLCGDNAAMVGLTISMRKNN